MMFLIFIISVFSFQSFAQELPLATQNFQLQQLINKSEAQIKELKEILDYKKQDASSLEKANQILEKMSSGIDKSLEKYQGTEVFAKALLDLQTKNDFKKTYGEPKELRDQVQNPFLKNSKDSFQDIVSFQKDSVQANQSDFTNQEQLQKELQSAPAGFVPKLAAQSQLGNWRTSTRLSAQMTELLAATHAIREELRLLRLKEQNSNALDLLVTGSEIQNKKLKEASQK